MRVLVTGGAGYIGSFTVRALQQAGHETVVFDNLCFGHRQAVSGELIVGDLADSGALDRCLDERSIDAIVHFAAFIEPAESMKDAGRFYQNNVANAINLLNAATRHGIDAFVFSSTAGVYGDPETVPIKESAPPRPINVYAHSKFLVEQMLPWYETVHGLRSIVLRYFNAAGAALDGSQGQDHEPAVHIITMGIKAALGQTDGFHLFGRDYPTPDGTCIRDYIHVLDLATAHVRAVESLAHGGGSDICNVGTGRGYSNREVVSAVKEVTGVDFPVEMAPRRPGDPAELVADSTRLRRSYDWEPKYSDLESIIDSAWRWHRDHPHGYRDEPTKGL